MVFADIADCDVAAADDAAGDAVDEDLPAAGRQYPQDQSQQRAFSAPVRAGDAEAGAWWDAQGKIVDDRLRLLRPGICQVLQDDSRRPPRHGRGRSGGSMGMPDVVALPRFASNRLKRFSGLTAAASSSAGMPLKIRNGHVELRSI